MDLQITEEVEAVEAEAKSEQRVVDTSRCVCCLQIIDADDDAQKVSKREVAHTTCAFAVNDAFFFFAVDTESEYADVAF